MAKNRTVDVVTASVDSCPLSPSRAYFFFLLYVLLLYFFIFWLNGSIVDEGDGMCVCVCQFDCSPDAVGRTKKTPMIKSDSFALIKIRFGNVRPF